MNTKQVLNQEIPLQEAVEAQQKELLEQQKQLQAAIDICNFIKKNRRKSMAIDISVKLVIAGVNVKFVSAT